MAKPEDVGKGQKPVPAQGLQIEVTLADEELRPRFEPVVKRVAEVVREITGTHCSETVAAKLRW